MTQTVQQITEKSLIPDQQSSSQKVIYIQGRSISIKMIFKFIKYGTILSVIVFLLLGGISILGDTSVQVGGNRRIFDVYKNTTSVNDNVESVNTLFDKHSSKYVSDRTVNLFLEKESNENSDGSEQNSRFDDLEHFADYLISERYQGKNLLKLPLNLYEEKINSIVPESYSSKFLKHVKKTVQKTLQKHKLTDFSSVKQLKWSRVKKLVDNSKFDEIVELVTDNFFNTLWKWIRAQPEVILLIVDDSQVDDISSGNKKLLNRWIRQNEDSSDIIILSRYPVNKIYDTKQEDHLKAYEVSVSLEQLQQNSMCQYLTQSLKLNEVQCSALRTRFETVSELQEFVDNFKQQEELFVLQSLGEKGSQLLQSVCNSGHVHYYFYQNQQNAYNVLMKNKKSKKSRLDRQLEALIVKWSHLKKAIGLNKLKDVYLTLTSKSNDETNLTLREANNLGLVYSFDLHELRWSSEENKMEYEIRTGSICKDKKTVEEEIQSEIEQHEEQEKANQKENENTEDEDNENNQVQSQVEEQQYEQNFINYEKGEQEDTDGSQGADIEVEVSGDQQVNEDGAEIQVENEQEETEQQVQDTEAEEQVDVQVNDNDENVTADDEEEEAEVEQQVETEQEQTEEVEVEQTEQQLQETVQQTQEQQDELVNEQTQQNDNEEEQANEEQTDSKGKVSQTQTEAEDEDENQPEAETQIDVEELEDVEAEILQE